MSLGASSNLAWISDQKKHEPWRGAGKLLNRTLTVPTAFFRRTHLLQRLIAMLRPRHLAAHRFNTKPTRLCTKYHMLLRADETCQIAIALALIRCQTSSIRLVSARVLSCPLWASARHSVNSASVAAKAWGVFSTGVQGRTTPVSCLILSITFLYCLVLSESAHESGAINTLSRSGPLEVWVKCRHSRANLNVFLQTVTHDLRTYWMCKLVSVGHRAKIDKTRARQVRKELQATGGT